jgi:uncharacterized protein (DUF58 family)
MLRQIRISPKIIGFIITGLVFLFAGIHTKLDIFYFLFLFSVVLSLLDIILLIVNVLVGVRLAIEKKVTPKLNEQEELRVSLILHNRGVFPLINIGIEDFLTPAQDEKEVKIFLNWLMPDSIQALHYGCICPQRGKYTIGPLRLIFCDFLGLFSLQRTLGLSKEAFVYPELFPIVKVPRLVKGNLPWFGIETTSVSGDEHEFYGVREYKRGDPIKRIHWLSTAKKSKLIVKEFQKYSHYQVSMVFVLNEREDFGQGKESISEYTIKILASLSRFFIEKGVTVQIVAHTGKVNYFSPNKGEGYLEEILTFCATATRESRITFAEFLQEYSKYIYPNSTVFAFLTDDNLDVLSAFLALKTNNISVIPIIFISSTFLSLEESPQEVAVMKGNILKRLSHIEVDALLVSRGDNLEKIFQ